MKKVTVNYIFNMLYNIITLIVPLITTPYISRTIGAEGIGTYSYCLSISTYFIIMGTLGIPIYARREIAFIKDNKRKLNQIFSELLILQFVLLFFSIVIYLVVIYYFNQYFYMSLMCGVGIISSMFDVSWLLAGLEDFKRIVGRSLLIKVISVVAIFIFVNTKHDIYIYALCIMLANLFGNLWLFIYTLGRVKLIKVRIESLKRHIKPAFTMLLPSMITTIYPVIDKTMIGMLGGSMSEVGFYEQSQKIVTLTLTLVTSLGTVLMPRLASLFSDRNNYMIKEYLNHCIQIVLLISLPLMFGLLAIADNLVPWFYGGGFEKVTILLKIFSPIIFFIGISDLIGAQLLIAIKKESHLFRINLVSTIANCIINLLLIPFIGCFGAAIATVIAELFKMILSIKVSINYIKIRELMGYFLKIFLISMIMGSFVCLIGKNILVQCNMKHTLLLVGIGFLIYTILLIIVKDKTILNISKIIKSKEL